jgi:hypothetical protein
VLAEWIRRIPQ